MEPLAGRIRGFGAERLSKFMLQILGLYMEIFIGATCILCVTDPLELKVNLLIKIIIEARFIFVTDG